MVMKANTSVTMGTTRVGGCGVQSATGEGGDQVIWARHQCWKKKESSYLQHSSLPRLATSALTM